MTAGIRLPTTQKDAFIEVAELTRQSVEDLVTMAAADVGRRLSEGEVKALVWAQISGVITAAANGFAGLLREGPPKGFDRGRMQQALRDQFDDAVEQALRMRSVAND